MHHTEIRKYDDDDDDDDSIVERCITRRGNNVGSVSRDYLWIIDNTVTVRLWCVNKNQNELIHSNEIKSYYALHIAGTKWITWFESWVLHWNYSVGRWSRVTVTNDINRFEQVGSELWFSSGVVVADIIWTLMLFQCRKWLNRRCLI